MLFSMPEPDRHWGCRINDRVVWHGYKAIIMQNELLQIVILSEKGSEIVQFLYKPQDIDFLWRSPNPLQATPTFVPTGGNATSPFFDRWSGGWFEVAPNGGTACDYKGASLGFFAETINIPWNYRILHDSPEQVTVGFWVKTYRTPLLIQKTLTLRSMQPALQIEETLVNEGHEPVDFMWGHHPVVGAPFLSEYCRLSAPKSQVQVFHAEDGPDHRMGLHQTADWPVIADRNGNPLDLRIVPSKASRTMDNCYLKDFTEGWIAIRNMELELGFGLAWDASVFQYVWLWQALGGGLGYPWYGRTYCIGLEPWTSYPCAGLQTAFDNGTARTLAPGAALTSWLTAAAIPMNHQHCDTEIEQVCRDGSVAYSR